MKYLTLILTTIFLFSSPVVWSEEVDFFDLVKREGIWYKRFSDEPYSGTVVGIVRGKVVKGKQEGKWTGWYESGELKRRMNYKNGKQDGPQEGFYLNGQPQLRGHYKNGKQDGLVEGFYESGRLLLRGHYRTGNKVGKWEFYNKDGTLDRVENYGE